MGINETGEAISASDVLFRDDNFIAIQKPTGLLVHRTRIARGNAFALQRVRDYIKQWVYPVHRLDRPTSGVLIFALDPDSARRLATLFRQGEVNKTYLAVVRGFVDREGKIDYPLKEQKGGVAKEAVTTYAQLADIELPLAVGRYSTARYSLVKVHPLTGRMHQIRKHFAHIFHPVIGDSKHGDWRHNKMFKEKFGCNRLLLHAHSLSFVDPVSEKEIVITADVPPSMSGILEELGWAKQSWLPDP